jgi:hypothetical protein
MSLEFTLDFETTPSLSIQSNRCTINEYVPFECIVLDGGAKRRLASHLVENWAYYGIKTWKLTLLA